MSTVPLVSLASEVDPNYRLARLTQMLVENAMRLDGPTKWDTVPQNGA